MTQSLRRFASVAALMTLALAGSACGGRSFGFGGGLVGLLIFVAWVIAIIQVIQSGMPTDKKILWMLLIIFLPLLGAILWFVLGRK